MVQGVPARFAMPASEISTSRLYRGFDSSSALHADEQMSAAAVTCPTSVNCHAMSNFAERNPFYARQQSYWGPPQGRNGLEISL